MLTAETLREVGFGVPLRLSVSAVRKMEAM